jgi:hypothetical protein
MSDHFTSMDLASMIRATARSKFAVASPDRRAPGLPGFRLKSDPSGAFTVRLRSGNENCTPTCADVKSLLVRALSDWLYPPSRIGGMVALLVMETGGRTLADPAQSS